MITREDLEKAGIYYNGNKVYPNRFFIPQVGDVNLYEPYSWGTVFMLIFNHGYEHGVRKGKKDKIEEIKSVLDINYED